MIKYSTRTLLYRPGKTPGPTIQLPPSNQIWYTATSQISSNIGSPVSHSYDPVTRKGVLEYSFHIGRSTAIAQNAFKGNGALTQIWWPNATTHWINDCMHSCPNLREIYAGSGLNVISTGTCIGGTTLHYIGLVDNDYFYKNTTGLVQKSDNTLVLGTYNLDIRNTPCTTIGSRCMADMNLEGATLYFPSTVTAFAGDYNMSKSNVSFTVYFYSVEAPTLSHPYNLYTSGTNRSITVHIPVGSLESYQTKWSTLKAFDLLVFIEDL